MTIIFTPRTNAAERPLHMNGSGSRRFGRAKP